jgi:PPK2 family polyphosphate:nucleotide phosphotransferase
MKINSKHFRVNEGEAVKLKDWPTIAKPIYKSKQQYQELLQDHVDKLSSLQELFYASNNYSLLLVFQSMDAGGKDGAIKHVMSGINPQGCQVYSFKQPSATELKHDFLWRTTQCLPERGHIGIFNRSYYEEVLIVRVHPHLLSGEGLTEEISSKKNIWQQRYHSIVNFENHLHHNNTRVVKFFLHLSKEEQRKRFLDRIDQPHKNWKFSIGDIEERKFWKQYMQAYEDCLSATSTHEAPWYIIPADDKHMAQLIISRIVLDTLEELDLTYPKLDAKHKQELRSIRKMLTK